jgi:hypothetical protein
MRYLPLLGLVAMLSGCVTHGYSEKEYDAKTGALIGETKVIDGNLIRNTRMALVKGENAFLNVTPIEFSCPQADAEKSEKQMQIAYAIEAKGEFIYITDDRELGLNLKELAQAGMSMYFQGQLIQGASEGAGTLWDWVENLAR